jgi:hypothetical protein
MSSVLELGNEAVLKWLEAVSLFFQHIPREPKIIEGLISFTGRVLLSTPITGLTNS